MANVSFRLDHPKKGEKSSILVRLYISEKIKPELSTGERVLPEHWNGSRVKGGSQKVEINLHLNSIETDLLQMWRDNKKASADRVKELARQIIKGQTTEKKTIFEALDNFLTEYKSSKKGKTLDRYNALKTRLTEFCKSHTCDLSTLDLNFYDAFKKFLYAVPNPNYPEHRINLHPGAEFYILSGRGKHPGNIGLFNETVFKYFVNFKTFLRWAEKRGYKVHPSFKDWEIIKRVYPPIALSEAEIDKIEKSIMPSEALRIARDYLLMECYTGQRISDIKKFNRNDYHDHKWSFTQTKGDRAKARQVTVYFTGFCAPALFILGRNNFSMPQVSEQKINKGIKKVCQIAGIDTHTETIRWAGNKKIKIEGPKYEFISSHTGKKSFITILAERKVPLKVISELSGTTIQTIIKYYLAESDQSVIEKYLNGEQKDLMRVSGF